MQSSNELRWIDYLIILIYFVFALGIGFVLKRFVKTSADFLLSGRSIPAWIAGLAFLSANLGAQEVIGMAASGAKYGIATSHFHWLGAIPAMVFVGIFMMPFYYGSKAKSVPDYLSLRYDEKTRAFNAFTFAGMTMMSSGISMYAMALLLQTIHVFDTPFRALGLPNSWVFCQHHHFGDHRPRLYLFGWTNKRDLQRSYPVFPDRRRLLPVGFPWTSQRGRLERAHAKAATSLRSRLARDG